MRFFFQTIFIASLGMSCAAQENCSALKEDPNATFQVSGGFVSLLPDVFLLVRKDGQVGAIRLTALKQSGIGTEGTSTYESFFQKDGSKPFSAKNSDRKTGQVHIKPLNLLRFQTGPDRVRIGRWSFRMVGPSLMGMNTYRGSERDYGFEFAATSACRPTEIDTLKKNLRWFIFNQNTGFALRVADQPK